MVKIVQLPLLLLLLCSITNALSPGCIEQYDVKEYSKSIYGSVNAFYDIAKGISDGLQRPLNNETMQDLYNLFNDKNFDVNTQHITNELFNNQVPSIVFASAGLVYVAITFAIIIVIIVLRCCCNSCNSNKENVKPSSRLAVAAMIFLLIVCFSFILTSVIIYNQSATYLYASVEQSNVHIGNVVTDLKSTLDTGSNSMSCAVNTSINSAFNQVQNNAANIPTGVTDAFLESSKITPLQKILFDLDSSIQLGLELAANVSSIAKSISLNPLLLPTCKSQLNSLFNKTTNSIIILKNDATSVNVSELFLNATIGQLAPQISSCQSNINQTIQDALTNSFEIQSKIDSAVGNISSIVNNTMDIVNHLRNAIDEARTDIVTDSGWTPIKGSIRAILTVPEVIALFFSLFAIIVMSFYLIKPTDNAANRAAGYVMIIGAYAIIFLSILAMGVAVTAFLGGWLMSGSCKALFEDNTFRMYSLADNLSWSMVSLEGSKIEVSARDILLSCSANKTVFVAVKGDQIISTKMVNNDLKFQFFEDKIDKIVSNSQYSIPNSANNADVDQQTKLTVYDSQSYEPVLSNFLPDCNENDLQNLKDITNKFVKQYQIIADQMKQFQEDLQFFNNGEQASEAGKQGMLNYTNAQFDLSQQIIDNSTADLLNELNTNIFPGIYLYYNFENGGTIMCDTTGKPVHGLWASAGLGAIFFLPLALILFWASSTLFARRNFMDREAMKEEKLRKKLKEQEKKKKATNEDNSESDSERSSEVFQRPPINVLSLAPTEDYNRSYRSPYVSEAFKNSTRVQPYEAQNDTLPRLRREPYISTSMENKMSGVGETRSLPRYDALMYDDAPSLHL